ncbi:hypothetical protein DJ537_24725 [Enterobacter hormaechei]|nr:hypothetical protein DJ519_01495 [Klebsiella michiganensis]TYF68826.1 hypothetical protein DJ537_24725 [Enterobacter hormaechei]
MVYIYVQLEIQFQPYNFLVITMGGLYLEILHLIILYHLQTHSQLHQVEQGQIMQVLVGLIYLMDGQQLLHVMILVLIHSLVMED